MDLAKYAALFLSDGREHLQQSNALLLEWERDPPATEPVAGLFRSFHTIKGMAATMGYTKLADLVHAGESVLDAVRSTGMPATRELLELLFRTLDAIESALEDAAAGSDGARLSADLIPHLTQFAQQVLAGSSAPRVLRPPAPGGAEATPPLGEGVSVTLVVRRGAAMPFARAMLALRRIEGFGRVSGLTPNLAQVDPQVFDGRFRLLLEGGADPGEIRRAVLEVGEIDVVDISTGDPHGRAGSRARQIRVDLVRLDELVNNVGELMVARNRLVTLAAAVPGGELEVLSDRISRLVTNVHAEVLGARMAPIGEVFDRFPRAVRDLGRQLGREVRLEVVGREIEVDRSVLEELGEPLLHLVRNAVDHGIEPPKERRAKGKPVEGMIRLEATRQRSRVVIRVTDDGRGVDRARVRDRLLSQGHDAGAMEDDQLLKILARPGFSLADRITEVSGRGVGMDAVLNRVRALGGAIDMHSTLGQGTSFVLRLPLTLAVVQALLVGVGRERYALPLGFVEETGQPDPAGGPVPVGAQSVSFRGRSIPAVDLRVLAEITDPLRSGQRPLVVMAFGERRAALVVDTLLGQSDLVLETVDAPRGMPRWLNGAAILADGVPAFILDPTALF